MSKHVIRQLHHISRDLEDRLHRHYRHLENKEFHLMALDFSAFTAIGARIDAVAASLTSTISGDVSTAVAAQEASDQAQLGSVASDLAARVTALEAAASATATPPAPPAS